MSYFAKAGPRTRPSQQVFKSGPARQLWFQEAVVAWIALVVAGVLEVVWATALKQSEGFTRPLPSLVTAVTVVASFLLLGWAMRSLPLGTAYAIFTGIGAIGAFVVGIVALGEGAGVLRVAAAGMIFGGILLMKAASPH